MTARVLAYTAGMSRAEWLAARRQGLGASDAAIVTGLSPYRVSQYQLWLEKRGELDDDEATPRMEWGLKLEDPIVEHFAAKHPELVVRRRRAILQSVEHPWMLCNLDRDLRGVPEHLEVKTSHDRRPWDRVPDQYEVQALHQLAVTGHERVRFAVLFDGWLYREYVVERHEQVIADLVKVLGDWWQHHIVDGHMPPVDGSAATSDALAERYPTTAKGSSIDLGRDALDLVGQRELQATLAKVATAEVDRIDNVLKARLGEHEAGLVDGREVVTWRHVNNPRVHNCPDCQHQREHLPRRLNYPKG